MKLLALCLLLAGCTGIPSADPPVPKVKPCEVVVMDQKRAVCLTRPEFKRWLENSGL